MSMCAVMSTDPVWCDAQTHTANCKMRCASRVVKKGTPVNPQGNKSEAHQMLYTAHLVMKRPTADTLCRSNSCGCLLSTVDSTTAPWALFDLRMCVYVCTCISARAAQFSTRASHKAKQRHTPMACMCHSVDALAEKHTQKAFMLPHLRLPRALASFCSLFSRSVWPMAARAVLCACVCVCVKRSISDG